MIKLARLTMEWPSCLLGANSSGDEDTVAIDPDSEAISSARRLLNVGDGMEAEEATETKEARTIDDIASISSWVSVNVVGVAGDEVNDVEDENEEDGIEDEEAPLEDGLDGFDPTPPLTLCAVFFVAIVRYFTHQNASQIPLLMTLFFRMYATTSRNTPSVPRINRRSIQSDVSSAVMRCLDVEMSVVNVL
jgi:hypothetical protein